MTNNIEIRESVTGVAKQATGAKRRALLIKANTWGSTAYYDAEPLERDGGRVFTAGTQMFENHLTENESWERPEGDVGKLIGKLTSDAIYEAEGPEGAGLYADVEFYESYVPRINEIADDIGLSVRAKALTEEAERDGRFGPVLVALLAAQSVDVVTKAGAGGKLTSILESKSEPAGRPITKEGTSVTDVTKEDFEALATDLKESIAGLLAGLKESLATLAPAAEVEKTDKTDVEDEPKGEVVIDHAAIVEALRTNELPAASAAAIVKDLTEGKSFEEAIKVQTDLREAFTATQETGNVTYVKENAKATGLARSVELLG